jgi:hypothetical protein
VTEQTNGGGAPRSGGISGLNEVIKKSIPPLVERCCLLREEGGIGAVSVVMKHLEGPNRPTWPRRNFSLHDDGAPKDANRLQMLWAHHEPDDAPKAICR